MKTEKKELQREALEALKEEIEDWMNKDDIIQKIVDTLTKKIPYYDDCCFYLRKEDDSFQIGKSSGGVLPHIVEEDTLVWKSILKMEDLVSFKEVEHDPSSFSEMSVVFYDPQKEVKYPYMVFYAVSEEKEAFSKEDINFIKDIYERFIY